MSNNQIPVEISYGDPYYGHLQSHASFAGSDGSSSAASTSTSAYSSTQSSFPELSASATNLGGYPFVPGQFNESAEHLPSRNHTQRTKLTGSDPDDPSHRQAKVDEDSAGTLYLVDIRPGRPPVKEVYVQQPTPAGKRYSSTKWPGYDDTTNIGPAHATDKQHSDDCRRLTKTVEAQGRCYCAASEADGNEEKRRKNGKKKDPNGKK